MCAARKLHTYLAISLSQTTRPWTAAEPTYVLVPLNVLSAMESWFQYCLRFPLLFLWSADDKGIPDYSDQKYGAGNRKGSEKGMGDLQSVSTYDLSNYPGQIPQAVLKTCPGTGGLRSGE